MHALILFHISFFLSICLGLYKPLKQAIIGTLIINALVLVFLTILYQHAYVLTYFFFTCIFSLTGVIIAHKIVAMCNDQKSLVRKEINDIQEELRTLIKKNETITTENAGITEQLEELETLFEGMKLMNTTLEFEKTLQIFSNLLTKLTSFEEGRLITLDELTRKPNNIFRLFRSEDDTTWVSLQDSELSSFHAEVFNATLEKNELIFKDFSKKSTILNELTAPDDVQSILALPLRKHEQISAVLLLSQCQQIDIEKIRLMVIQLAMELEKTQLYEIVKELSVIDGLTKLYLRRHLFSLLKNEIERLGEKKLPLALMMIDIDRFKTYNDEYGHLVGDMILQQLSLLMKKNFRQIDIIGRYGGEEFIIALPETTKEMATIIAERFRENVEHHDCEIYGHKLNFTISIGISAYPHDATSLMGLVKKADKALYTAKSEGRNRVELAN